MSAWILVIMVAGYGSPNLETHRWLTEKQCIARANAIKVPRRCLR
jgi:hypothetical protein